MVSDAWLLRNMLDGPYLLRTEHDKILADAKLVVAENEKLRAELSDLRSWKEKMKSGSRLVIDNERLQAELAEYQNIKPVACRVRLTGLDSRNWINHPLQFGIDCKEKDGFDVEFLFAHPTKEQA